MTAWHPTTPLWYSCAAEQVCTPKQLDTLKLASHELSTQQIADRLGITRQAAWARYDAACRAIRQHLDQKEDAA
jgi:DNA-directed RNA polymerase specialized sigma24 family protein